MKIVRICSIDPIMDLIILGMKIIHIFSLLKKETILLLITKNWSFILFMREPSL